MIVVLSWIIPCKYKAAKERGAKHSPRFGFRPTINILARPQSEFSFSIISSNTKSTIKTMGAPLRRLAEGHSDEPFWGSQVDFLPFPAPLSEPFFSSLRRGKRGGVCHSYTQLRGFLSVDRSCGMDSTYLLGFCLGWDGMGWDWDFWLLSGDAGFRVG